MQAGSRGRSKDARTMTPMMPTLAVSPMTLSMCGRRLSLTKTQTSSPIKWREHSCETRGASVNARGGVAACTRMALTSEYGSELRFLSVL